MIIDCDNCSVRGRHCSGCVVSHLIGPPGTVDLDQEACDALDVLAASGLVPPLRLVPVIDVSALPGPAIDVAALPEAPVEVVAAAEQSVIVDAEAGRSGEVVALPEPSDQGHPRVRREVGRFRSPGRAGDRPRRGCPAEDNTPALWTG